MADSEKSTSTADAHKAEAEKTNFTGCLFWIVLFLLCLWLCWPKIVSWWSTPSSDETATVSYSDIGSFGDLFGSFNALVSMLAFIGFLCALYLQRKDLQLQREEMKQSRREMELQTTQFREQTELLKEQIAQQNKRNKTDKYLDFAYKIYERIEKLDSEHKGIKFVQTIHRLQRAYFHKHTSLFINPEDIIRDHATFIELYSEIGSMCRKIHRITDILARDKEIREDDKATIEMVLRPTCSVEMLVALDYCLLVDNAVENNSEREDMIKSIFNTNGSTAAKEILIESTVKFLHSGYEKPKEIANANPEKLLEGFITALYRWDKNAFI